MATPATGPANRPTLSFGNYMPAPGELAGVGFWLRALARILDYVVFNLVVLVAMFLAGIAIGVFAAATRRPLPPGLGEVSWQYFVAAFVGYIFYHSVCEGFHGCTLGKVVCQIVVVSEDGKRCGLKAAIGRSLAYYIDTLFFGIVAYLSMKDSPKQQRLGDKWCHTIVAKRSDVAPNVLRSLSQFSLVFVVTMFLVGLLQISFVLLKLLA